MLGLAVDRLPDAYRSVFMLREVEQMSTAETAECLNLSEEAVKTRLSRSRFLLRKDLEKQMGPILVKCYSYLGEGCDRTVKAVLERIRNKQAQRAGDERRSKRPSCSPV
jgi:RNA polymerase sigma-70 factor (ECF subfamily)